MLQQIKSDDKLKLIPVVVLTSSREERDMVSSYQLGVNAYVVKPVDFHEFVNAIKELGVFWAVINEPPPGSVPKATLTRHERLRCASCISKTTSTTPRSSRVCSRPAASTAEVDRVETRDDFLAALEAGGFDLILADFSLPSFDGLSALQLALEQRPDVPFIFVSGTLGEEVAIEAVKIGATDYVLKERLSRIVSSVHRALREAREQAERKQAEQQLRRSEAFLAEGQRISHTGSWGWVLSSGEVTWSEEQYRMLGFEPGRAEPSVALFLTAVHPEDRSRVRHALEEATRAKRAYAIDYRVVLPDGSVRHLCSVGRPLTTDAGDVDEYIGTTTDVTERVQAEAALLARQEMLDLAQKAARAVAFEWRLGAGAGQQDPRSPELDAIYGLAPGSYDGTFETWKGLVHPEDLAGVEGAMAHASQSGEVAAEYRVVHPDGAVRWLQAKGRMFFDDQGRPARVVGFMLDVTERHQAEEELRRLEARLRQAQRLEAMGTLAGGIAHDFNNILGAILGYGERALRDAPRDSRLRGDLESILAAGERAARSWTASSRSAAVARGSARRCTWSRWCAKRSTWLPPNCRRTSSSRPRCRRAAAAMLGDPTRCTRC